MGKYIVISNFKGGLDTRRLDTEQLPGTLSSLVDAHINQGGEIEKRKAFVLFATFPANVFGLEVTTQGLLSFGSIAPPAMPTGILYQRLQDPAGGAMTGYVSSTQFGGEAFVIANFDTTLTWPFYNGTVVQESVNGKVLTTNQTTLAQNLANLIAALPGFFVSAVVVSGGLATFTMWSQAGVNYSIVLAMGSGSTGLVTARQIYASVPQIPAIAATGGFQITGGSSAGSGAITSVKVNGVEIYNTSGSVPPLPYNDSAGTGATFDAANNAQTASDLVYKLNLGISTPSYTAVANANMVTITDNSGAGASANGFMVQVTATGDLCIDDCAIGLTGGAITTPSSISNISVDGGVTNLLSSTVNWVTSTEVFAGLVAANIAAHSGVTGYTAYHIVGETPVTLRISKLVRNSNDVVPTNCAVTFTAGATTPLAIVPGITGSTNTGVGLAVAVSPLFNTIDGHGKAHKLVTSALITAIASGGKPPYTYLWSLLNTTNGPWVVNSPNTASTTFSVIVAQGANEFLYAQCTVTDSASVVVKSLTVNIEVTAG